MSESVCPKCGAKKYCRADDEGVYHSDPDCFWTVFECGTSLHDNGETLIEWPTCLRRQLAQRDERIRELEAEVERLQARVEELERGILEYVREKLLLMAKD